jgi:hypothetical protein
MLNHTQGFQIRLKNIFIYKIQKIIKPSNRLSLTQRGNGKADDGVAPTQGNPRLPNLSNDCTLQKEKTNQQETSMIRMFALTSVILAKP